jgi:uncharacterized protein YbjT (DUF2867 family)
MTTVLVTGARGNTGREVAALLAARDGVSVRGGGRDPDVVRLNGVTAVRFDWAEPDTWAGALEDVEAVYLARPDIEDAPDRVEAFLAAAAHVDTIVLISEMGAEVMPADSWVRRVEQAFAARAATGTILRPTWFAQVLIDERFYRDAIRDQRELELPSAGAGISFVDTRDIAAVAVEALLDRRHVGESYTLSGPQALSLGHVADRIGAATGEPVRYVDPPVSKAIGDMGAAEPWLVAVLTDLYERIGTGGFGRVTDAVESVSGATPRSLEGFIDEHATVWRR